MSTEEFTVQGIRVLLTFEYTGGSPGNLEEPPEGANADLEDIELDGWSIIHIVSEDFKGDCEAAILEQASELSREGADTE